MSARRRQNLEQTLFAFAEETPERRPGIDELFAAQPAWRRGARFLRLLAGVARFRALGPYNALLVALQRPKARCVFSPARWRALHREVRPDAAPLVLLRPFAPVSFVYDVADTRVMRGRTDRLPADCLLPDDAVPCAAVDDATVQRLLGRLPYWGIGHETLPTGPADVGEIHVADDRAADLSVPVDGGALPFRPVYVLRTRAAAPAPDLFVALVHALARLFCHHLRGAYERGRWEGRRLDAATERLEALSVCWLVCRRARAACSVDAPLRALLASGDVPTSFGMDRVLAAVAEIEKMLRGAAPLRDGFLARLSPSFAAAARARHEQPAEPASGPAEALWEMP